MEEIFQSNTAEYQSRMKTLERENMQLRLQLKACAIPPTEETVVAMPNTVRSSEETAVANVKEPEDGSSGELQQTRKV